MILRIFDRFRALPPSACPVFLLPVVFLAACLLGSLLGSALAASVKSGSSNNPTLVQRVGLLPVVPPVFRVPVLVLVGGSC